MIAIALLILAIGLSLIITRTAAVMLELTGMSRDSARFQARAAYCGVGYASRESDGIVEHPLRRRIISSLMLLGNAGTATVVATMIVSFTKGGGETTPIMKLAAVGFGLVVLFVFAKSKFVDRQLTHFVQWALKTFSQLDLSDYVALLNLSEGFSILEVEVQEGDWLCERDLMSLALPKEGVLVLGIHKKDGRYVGAPTGTTQVDAGDRMTVYGRRAHLEELNSRKHGTDGVGAHLAAVSERAQESQKTESTEPE